MMLMPLLLGAGLAVATGNVARGAGLALSAFVMLALAAFLVRQPIGALVRVWRGRARRSSVPLAAGWTAGLSVLVVLCGVALLLLGRNALLPLAIPGGIALLLSLAIAALAGPRGLGLEVIGALGLALTAPGAYGALSGTLDGVALAAWIISAAHSLMGVLHVRLRVATRREQVTRGMRWSVVVSHLVAFVGVALAGFGETIPLLLALPFGLLMARAMWVAWQVPPLENVRRFGFTEMGLSLLFAGMVVAAYLLVA